MTAVPHAADRVTAHRQPGAAAASAPRSADPPEVDAADGPRFASRGVWVFADQAIVSLANFAAPILVGRCGGQVELGRFALGFSVYLFALGMGRALIWTAYTSRLPHEQDARRAGLTGSATAHVAGFLLALTGSLMLVAAIAAASGAVWLAGLMLVLAPCAAAMLVREHVRRVCLARLAVREVLIFDVAVSAVQLALLGWLAYRGTITATTAFGSLAAAALLGVGWLAWRRRWWSIEAGDAVRDWRDSWSVSRWLAAGAASVQLGNQGYRWLLAAVASVAELGRLGAAQVVVQVTNPLVIGVSNYLGPVSAGVFAAGGVRELWRFTVRCTLAMVAAIGMFLLLVAATGVPAITAVFGPASEGVTTLLLVTLAAGALSEALLIPVEYASVNRGRTRLMFHTALVRLAVNGSLGFALVGLYGAEAIGVGMLLGSGVALGWQWWDFAAEVRRVG